MSGPWEQYGQSAGPWQQYASQRDQGVVPQFIAGAVDSMKQVGDTLAHAMGIPANDATRNIASVVATGKPMYQAPQPMTVPGQYARTMGNYATALATPGTLAQRVLGATVPALASETAGQVTKGTPFEAPARVAGGLLGGIAAGATAARIDAPKVANAPTPIPGLADLQQAKTNAYDAVRNAGVQYAPQSVQNMAANIGNDLASVDLDPVLHPKASRALQIIQDRAANGQLKDLSDLERARQIVSRSVMSSPDRAEQFMGGKMLSGIDQFINNAGPQDVIGSDPQQAAGLVNNARVAYAQYRKMDDVLEALKNAEFKAARSGSGGNVDNATRQALDQLRKNGTWTPDEETALEQAIKGGNVQNLFRQLGKASPEGNGLMQVLNMGEAVHSGGASLPLTVGATLAKRHAEAMTQQNVNKVLSLIGSGGQAPSPGAAPPPDALLTTLLQRPQWAGSAAPAIPQAMSALKR